MRRVVVTGIGPVCAGARGRQAFWDLLLEKRCPLQPIPAAYEAHYRYRTRFYVPAPALEDGDKSREGVSRLAVAGAALALEDAGLAQLEDAGLAQLEDAGVVLGVGMGGLGTAFASHTAHTGGGGRFHRLVIPLAMPNAPAAWMAIISGARGECHTVSAACASGTVAVGEAFRKIAGGYLDAALTGGVDCLNDSHGSILRGFDSLRALTTAPDGLPRPFSRGRSGFLFNEGAGCVLILEEAQRALRRGARIYAEIAGYTCATAADGIVQMPEDITRLQGLFEPFRKYRIDYLNAHGTGTEQNDRIESALIRSLWGDGPDQPFIGSTKGILGHSIGASGALEAAATALSIHTGRVHGNLTGDVVDGLNCPPDSRELAVEHALSASYGFGGHNALLHLRRFTP